MADVFDFYVRDNRKITFDIAEPIMREDSGVTDFRFHIPKTINGLDMSDWAWWLVFVNAKKEKYSIALTLSDDPERPLEYNLATYTVDYAMSIKAGAVQFALEAINAGTGGAIDNEWHTLTYETKVKETLQGNQAEYAETESDIISALLIEVRNKVNQLVGGATPTPAQYKAQMTDPQKVYLYTGSERGEYTGNWYYHNGTTFVSGGVYGTGVVDSVPTQGSTNAVSSGGVWSALQNIDVTTDTTLSVSGKPADAKAVGDALADKVDAVSGKGLSTNDYSDTEKQKVTDATADLSAITTATAEDAGKALKAKTVTDGKVTEWEFGEAGENSDNAVVDYLVDELCEFVEITAEKTRTNIKINAETGLVQSDNKSEIAYFPVVQGTTIKATTAVNMQFQTDSNALWNGTSNRVGSTYEEGDYFLTVPETAKYVAITVSKAEPVASVYLVENIAEDVEKNTNDISALQTNVDEHEVFNRLDMVTEVSTENSPQIADVSQYTWIKLSDTVHEYRNVHVDFSQIGKYYTNPIGYCSAVNFKLYDSNDNLLTYNGSNNNFEFGKLNVVEKVDDTTLIKRVYASVEKLKADDPQSVYTYTYSGTISYAVIGNFRTTENSPNYGITVGRLTNVYIPYGKNITYNDELYASTWDEFVDERKFEIIPEKMLNPWMQRSVSLTNNLLDDRKIDWNPNSAKYLYLKSGETIPVTGGTTIMCNKGLDAVKWLDANSVETSLGNKGANIPIEIPSGAVAITFQKVWASQITNGYEPVYIYYVDTQYPYDDANRNPLPKAQLNGYDINKNLYDQCVPEENSEVVRMMKTFAIREVNRRQDAFRIGTFNVYVNRQATNKEIIRKMMGTYGIDLCGFQESQNYQSGIRYNLGDYLRGWQFGYCSTAEEDLASARHIVSALEIVSSEAFLIGTGTNTCLKCVINMPRYKDYKDGLTTLSFYTYHGIVSSDAERILEVNDILAKVAVDTSDFIIVCGDTNDFSGQPNYSYDRWHQFEAAGLTPVHWGESETVTDRTVSIDNIFTSSNIKCLYYNVVNSGDWMYKPNSSSSPVPVSDHDFLYADLQFDFEAVIEARNQEGN